MQRQLGFRSNMAMAAARASKPHLLKRHALASSHIHRIAASSPSGNAILQAQAHEGSVDGSSIKSAPLGFAARFVENQSVNASRTSRVVNLVQGQHFGTTVSVRHYADVPAANPQAQDPLKQIFFNMMKKYKLFISELTKSKITLDPDDPKAVADYKALMDGVRKKVGVPSKVEKFVMMIKHEAAAAPDVKTFYKSLINLKARFGVTEKYEGDKMMLEAVEKVEKKIGRVLTRSDKEGVALLKKEFEVINKALGVNPNSLKQLEAELEFGAAKSELQHMKNEVVATIESHKKRHGLEDIKVDLRTLDHRNYL